MIVNPKDFVDCFYYKYVIFFDGTILFGPVDSDHSILARNNAGSIPVGAGKIKFRNKEYQIEETGSFTLDMPPDNGFDKILADFLGNFGYKEADEYIY